MEVLMYFILMKAVPSQVITALGHWGLQKHQTLSEIKLKETTGFTTPSILLLFLLPVELGQQFR